MFFSKKKDVVASDELPTTSQPAAVSVALMDAPTRSSSITTPLASVSSVEQVAHQPFSAAPGTPRDAAPSTELTKKFSDVRDRVHAAVGQVTLALSVVPRYRHQSIADLQTLVVDPLMRDRIAIASERSEDGAGAGSLAGIAFWATVSDTVDAKIREQIQSGTFPISLKPDEWTSGQQVWLLDVIAPSQKIASYVLANFKQVVKPDAQVHIHPVVARQVDLEMLRQMGVVAN
jgi:cytolysin-activating lysine-acyltransferase